MIMAPRGGARLAFGATGAEGEVVQLPGGHLYNNYRSDGPMVDRCPDGAQQCDTGWGGNISRACGSPSVPGRVAPHHCRYAMFSSDEGDTWHDGEGVAAAFGTPLPDLPDPGCKGSVTWWPGGDGLLASNVQNHGDPPIEAPHRYNLTLSFSRDGIAWPKRLSLYQGGASYSSVKMLRKDVAAVHFEAPWVVGAPTVLAIVDLVHVFGKLKNESQARGSKPPRKSDDAEHDRTIATRLGETANCTLNGTVRGGTMYARASPYSTSGWDGKSWQSCAEFCQTDPIGGHRCLAWELVPNYKVLNTTHPLACLFYATVPDCIESEAPAGVTGCGPRGLAAAPEKCCSGGQCRVAGFECMGKAGLYQCAKVSTANATNGTTYSDKQSCLQHCKAPPPPPPGPPPPPPVYDRPYLRFAQVIPISNLVVDCTIVQGTTVHTWPGYTFGQFSEWIAVFEANTATLTVAVAGKVLLTKKVSLTTGASSPKTLSHSWSAPVWHSCIARHWSTLCHAIVSLRQERVEQSSP